MSITLNGPAVGKFPGWRTDALIIGACLVGGALFGQLFRWPSGPVEPQLSVLDIALHNLGLALLAVAGTRYLARPMFGLSAWWLGMGLAGSVALRGVAHTALLSLPHIPLEIAAWLGTMGLSAMAWPRLLAVARQAPSPEAGTLGPGRLALVTAGLYVAAAISEWAEINLHWGG